MLAYGIMVAGFAALLAMLYNARRNAGALDFLASGIVLAAVWFTLCLAGLA